MTSTLESALLSSARGRIHSAVLFLSTKGIESKDLTNSTLKEWRIRGRQLAKKLRDMDASKRVALDREYGEFMKTYAPYYSD